MDIENVFIAVVVYLLGGFFFAGSLGMPDMSGIYPRYIALAMIVLNTLQLALVIAKKRDPDLSDLDLVGLRRALIIFAGTVVYIALMDLIGFFVMTTCFLLSMLWIFDIRKPATLIIVTASMVAFVYAGFKLAFGVPIPEGILF